MDCQDQKEHLYRINKIEESIEKTEEIQIEHGKKIEKIDASTKSAHKRIDEIGEIPKAVLKMSIAVENMTTEIKEIATSMKEHQADINKRVDLLEKQPAEKAYRLQKQILGYVLAILVAYTLGKFGISK